MDLVWGLGGLDLGLGLDNIMANLAINTSAWILENVGRATLMGSQEYCKSPDRTLLEYSRPYHLSITSKKVEKSTEECSDA